MEHVLLVYPETEGISVPDFWEGFDSHRDTILAALHKTPPGAGLRGILNPLGSTSKLTDNFGQFVPGSPMFQVEFAAYLQANYRSFETVMRAWAMATSDQHDIQALARLVPLWNGTRGVGLLWDPKTDKTYACDKSKSPIWRDIAQVISNATHRRLKNLVQSIRSECDVPVLQDWIGWSALYEGTSDAINGIGVRMDSVNPITVADSAGRGLSTVLRWGKPGWLLASSVTMNESTKDEAMIQTAVNNLGAFGIRGAFFSGLDATGLKSLGSVASSGSKAILDSGSVIPLFYPENATNPAVPMQLPGGKWWLPTPANGGRIDYGSQFYGYSYQAGGQSFTAIWRNGPPARVKLKSKDAKQMIVTTTDGSDPKPKFAKGALEVTIGETPVVVTGSDDPPVPDEAYVETILKFDDMLRVADARKADTTEQKYYFDEMRNRFNESPWPSFVVLRDQFWRLNMKLAPFTWIEAELCRDHTFGEVLPDPSCSAGGCLSLRTMIPPSGFGYYAEFVVNVRNIDDQEVWVAARIPAGQEQGISVTVAGLKMPLVGPPVSRYGAGFGWYRLGTVKLNGSLTHVRMQIDRANGCDIAVDVIGLFPGTFRPNGVTMPEVMKTASKK